LAQKQGGLLLRVRGELLFVPAHVAISIDPAPAVLRVPGAPAEMLGIAVRAGEVLPVISLGDEDRRSMVVCRYTPELSAARELIGLVGAVVVTAGSFEIEPDSGDHVTFMGERARTLDLAILYGRLQGGAWAERWGG
jgi:hypothetical protein